MEQQTLYSPCYPFFCVHCICSRANDWLWLCFYISNFSPFLTLYFMLMCNSVGHVYSSMYLAIALINFSAKQPSFWICTACQLNHAESKIWSLNDTTLSSLFFFFVFLGAHFQRTFCHASPAVFKFFCTSRIPKHWLILLYLLKSHWLILLYFRISLNYLFDSDIP